MAFRHLSDKLPDAFVMGIVVLLTGCVGLAEPRPVAVDLDRSAVTIRLSDNSLCTGPVSATRADNGQLLVSGNGSFRDCGLPLSYSVSADIGPGLIRPALEEVFAAIGLPDAIAPAAEVRLTTPDGRRWVFASPAAPNRDASTPMALVE